MKLAQEPTESKQQPKDEEIEHHLSLNALKGATGLGTIRFKAKIQGVDIQVLIHRAAWITFYHLGLQISQPNH